MSAKTTKMLKVGVGVAIGGILFAKFGKTMLNDILTQVGV